MLRILVVSAIFAVSASAAADQSGSTSRSESRTLWSDNATYEVVVARGSSTGGGRLIVNESDQFIVVLDLNMSRIDVIKPKQSVDMTETLEGHLVVALSVGDSELTYVDFAPGTTVIGKNSG